MTHQQHIRKIYRKRWNTIDPRRITQDFAHAAKGIFPLFERGAHAVAHFRVGNWLYRAFCRLPIQRGY